MPNSPEARAFLDALEEVDESSGVASSWKPETLDEWEKLLHALTTRPELWLHGRDIVSGEISDVVKDVYAVQGYPSHKDPIFPHLTRGVLTALDADGHPLPAIEVDFDRRDSDAPAYQIVTFANVGNKPVRVYAGERLLSPIRLSGAQFTLYPDERIRRLLKLEPSIFATAQRESRATVRYASGGKHLDALQVKTHHHGLIQSVSATLASAAAVRFGSWDEIALSHVALAAAGLLAALIFFIVSRGFAPALLAHVPGSPSPRLSRGFVPDVLNGHGLREIFQDAMRSAAYWKSEHLMPYLARLTQQSSRRIAWLLEAASRQIASLLEAASRLFASLQQESSRTIASLQQESSRMIASLQQASSRRIASLQQASSHRIASLQQESSRMFSSLQHDIVLPAGRRTADFLKGLRARARAILHDVLVRMRRLAVNVYLYGEFRTEPIEPLDGMECVERIHRLTQELNSQATDSSSRAAKRSVQKEAKRLARRLDSDLVHDFVSPTTTNFQILWALRLLATILARPMDDVPAVVHRWLDGADHVLRYEGREGIGPTIPEFLSLLQR